MRRPGAILAIPALLALLFAAGCDRKQGESPAVSAAGDSTGTVLAWVGDRALTLEDVRKFMETGSGTKDVEHYMHNPDILQVALASMVDQFVWGEIARQEGYRLTRAEQLQVDALAAQFLASRYVGDVVDKIASPTPEMVEEYYRAHADQYMQETRVAARHLLVDSKKLAEDILAKARAGADFEELVRRYSKDEATREMGGNLGYVSLNSEVSGVGQSTAFTRALLVMEPGQMGVLESGRGWHVVKVERKDGGTPRPLDEVKAEIEQALRMEKYGAIYNEQLGAAREKVGARYNSKGFEALTGVTDNCERLVQMANTHPEIPGRIELYRRVSFDFPDCDQAAYAQFMIGYLLATARRDPALAAKALQRLDRVFPNSEWAKAGKYLSAHLDEDPETLGTPEEVRQRAGG